ncbi:type II toxin-antitoxin system VapC family toxin [Phreatobacter stygius]|uniref:type II toxin-antitoxin system VapC family toxin n=1 Tax=Phreatobacter stygius TaxID=1940610 RepID=UPI00147780ED|nr:PIN domain-containing protein [Phreatobacter stygius]
MTAGRSDVAPALYLDANFFIRLFESATANVSAHDRLWDIVEAGRVRAVTSWLTYGEVLVQPLRDDSEGLVLAYEDLFAGRMLPLACVGVSEQILRASAVLRARWPALKLPDTIHLATAEAAACAAFVSSDRKLGVLDQVSFIDPDSRHDIDRFLTALP